MSSSFPDCFQEKLDEFDKRACLGDLLAQDDTSCCVFIIGHKTGASMELKATRVEVQSPELLVSEYYEESKDHTVRTGPWVVEDVAADKAENYVKSIMDNAVYFEAFVSEYGAESTSELLLSIREVAWEGSIAWQALEAFIAYSLATSVSYIGEDELTPRLIENRVQLALAKVWKDCWCSVDSIKKMISTSVEDASTVVRVLLVESLVFDFKYRKDAKAARRSVKFGKRLVSQLSEDLRLHPWSPSFEKAPLGVSIGKRTFDPRDVDCLVGSLLSLAKRKDNFFRKLWKKILCGL